MFLNWVYRKLGRGGFLDRSWHPNEDSKISDPNDTTEVLSCQAYWLGCPDPRQPGEARFNWMDNQMRQIIAALP
jgi:hypothetical protein